MSEEAHRIALICWHCSAERDIVTSRPPRFGFELAGIASEVGMVGYVDFRYERVLIFCNEDHARQQMTKSGHFRLHPKPIKEAA